MIRFPVVVLLLSLAKCEDDVINESYKPDLPPGTQQMTFSQPKLTEEEEKAHWFPPRYYCDACQIVTHNVGTAFQEAEEKIPKRKKRQVLGDIDVLEIVEDACLKSGFDQYSVQEFDGKLQIKGPAFPSRTGAGMSMGGGLWPVRYINYCGSTMERFTEDEIYAYYRQGILFTELCLKDDCKGELKGVPDAVNFRSPLAHDEEICQQNDNNENSQTCKKSFKEEL